MAELNEKSMAINNVSCKGGAGDTVDLAKNAGPHDASAEIINAKLILNGKRVDSVSGRTFAVRNPATQEIIGYVPKANAEDVHNAIEVAKRGKSIMAALPAHQRAQILKKTADLIGSHHEELSRLLCRENGKTIRQCRIEISTTQRLFVDFGEEAKRIGGNYLPMDAVPGLERMVAYTIRQPIGIVVGIVPFNYPAELFAHKIPGALAAGNAVIVKPPSKCPLTVLRIGELMLEAGLPPEGMQMITGSPDDMGDELFTNPAIGMISLTGSVASAVEIARKAAGTLKRTAFELGGTDPMIVLEDANLALAVEAVVQGRLTNGAGQICCAVKRVLVQASVYDEFLKLLVERVSRIKMGDPLEEDTELGPLISPSDAEKVHAAVQKAIQMGAKCLIGGERVGAAFYKPTVLVNVTPESCVMEEEVFGPVAPVYPFKDLDEAVKIANDSSFGLQSCVFSENVRNALKVAHRLEAGGVVINGASSFRPGNLPFGGFKLSGIGRESIAETVREMTEEKAIIFNDVL
ncbi:MAG TPA: aldehyde dehydrogenase family protein [Bryobacteraceae bacterium]|nr:aldehyde dehydrogenase family protein [Bryobacteraceae bacterium]HPU73829.1 aldehyde dehydrogenase family protein [Bryobacteraceae bacterium]